MTLLDRKASRGSVHAAGDSTDHTTANDAQAQHSYNSNLAKFAEALDKIVVKVLDRSGVSLQTAVQEVQLGAREAAVELSAADAKSARVQLQATVLSYNMKIDQTRKAATVAMNNKAVEMQAQVEAKLRSIKGELESSGPLQEMLEENEKLREQLLQTGSKLERSEAMLAALREALKKSDEHGREADRNLISARTELGMAGKVVGAALENLERTRYNLERTRYEQQPMAQQVGELISRYEELGREAKGAHDELRKQVSTLSRQLQDAEAAAEKQKAQMAESMAEVVAARVREVNLSLVKERDDLFERARKAEARLAKELVPLQMEITQLRGELEDLQGPLRASLMASLMACDCM
jgi:hypothetical protein